MKDDYMLNGQLKPSYNLKTSTNNQFVANYTTAQITSNTVTLENRLEEHQESFNELPN